MDAVTQLLVVEAAMESWSRSGRPLHMLTQAESMFERCAKPGPRRVHESQDPRSFLCTMLCCAVHAVLGCLCTMLCWAAFGCKLELVLLLPRLVRW